MFRMVLWALSASTGCGPQEVRQELVLPFERVVEQVLGFSGFKEEYISGEVVLVDVGSFLGPLRGLYEAANLTRGTLLSTLQGNGLDQTWEEARECKPGRPWDCILKDGRLHIELLGLEKVGKQELKFGVRYRRYDPEDIRGICPNELEITVVQDAGGSWEVTTVRRTVVC